MDTHHSGNAHHSGQEARLQQSETQEKFKLKFENNMKQFHERTESRANESGFNGNWRDILASAGFSVVTLAGVTVLAFLGTVGILSAAITAGAGFVIAAAGVAVATGYNIYRSKVKKRQLKRALNLLHDDDIDNQIALIADKLSTIYRYQLENCSPTDAERLADACFKALKHEMMQNEYLELQDLLNSSRLQSLIVKSALHVKKESVSINGRDDEKANTRGAITHAALYCQETDQFYRCDASKPAKYGVLFFATRQELNDYKLMIEKIKHDKKKWHYEKMPASQVRMLMRNQLFSKPHVNDDAYISRSDDSNSNKEVSGKQSKCCAA